MVRLHQAANEASSLALAQAFLSSLDRAFLPDGDYTVLPGLCDVHVHFREPGFSYKGTIACGSRAAARGGYTDVCTMPNLSPVPDCLPALQQQLDLIAQDAVISVHPYGAITIGEQGNELADLEGLAPRVIAFSDDGRGVQNEAMMRQAMTKAKALGKIIAAHCEQNELLHGGYIHAGAYSLAHGHRGISSESEWRPIQRDLKLAQETGCAYHVCHISTKESVALIRQAKAQGVDVTCETAPHYLTLCEDNLQEDGRFKMNPPLRTRADQEALIEGLLDGTIDIIATDHAPHGVEEKQRGLEGSPFGIVGLETALPALYTCLVKPGIVSMERLMELLVHAPRRRFGLAEGNGFSLWRLDECFQVNPADFLSKGRATPYAGETLLGVNYLTCLNGQVAYLKEGGEHYGEAH